MTPLAYVTVQYRLTSTGEGREISASVFSATVSEMKPALLVAAASAQEDDAFYVHVSRERSGQMLVASTSASRSTPPRPEPYLAESARTVDAGLSTSS